jgi:hypothetical protein
MLPWSGRWRLLQKFEGLTGSVSTLAFLPDDGYALTDGADACDGYRPDSASTPRERGGRDTAAQWQRSSSIKGSAERTVATTVTANLRRRVGPE